MDYIGIRSSASRRVRSPGLRRQLGGNFRDLTNHSDQPHLERYVEAEEDVASSGLRASADGEREDPRDFYARVMAHQRAMEDQAAASEAADDTDARAEATASLLSSVPPVTPEDAAMLAAQYASIDAAAGTAPAPDDERFEAAPPKPDQQVWVKDTPDRTPVRDEAESDDEDVALLKQMSSSLAPCAWSRLCIPCSLRWREQTLTQ